MSIPRDKLELIWQTFTDEFLSDSELTRLNDEVDNHSDVLAKILLETDFLEKYPVIERVLRSKAPRVSRSLLDEQGPALAKTITMQRQQLQSQLFEKQKSYTNQLASLVELEQEIIQLKKKLDSYQ